MKGLMLGMIIDLFQHPAYVSYVSCKITSREKCRINGKKDSHEVEINKQKSKKLIDYNIF